MPDLEPGDVVIVDNLPAHKVADERKTFEAPKAELLYPLPVFNSIDMAFSKQKALPRKTGRQKR